MGCQKTPTPLNRSTLVVTVVMVTFQEVKRPGAQLEYVYEMVVRPARPTPCTAMSGEPQATCKAQRGVPQRPRYSSSHQRPRSAGEISLSTSPIGGRTSPAAAMHPPPFAMPTHATEKGPGGHISPLTGVAHTHIPCEAPRFWCSSSSGGGWRTLCCLA